MAGNTIKGAEGIKELTELYTSLAKQIDAATKETKDFLTQTQKLPSEYIKALEKLKTTQAGYNEKLNEVEAKLKKVNADYLENKRIITATARTQAKLTQATSKEALELQKLQVELRNVKRNTREVAIVSSALATQFEKDSIRLIRLRRRYKGVALAQGENSKSAPAQQQ